MILKMAFYTINWIPIWALGGRRGTNYPADLSDEDSVASPAPRGVTSPI